VQVNFQMILSFSCGLGSIAAYGYGGVTKGYDFDDHINQYALTGFFPYSEPAAIPCQQASSIFQASETVDYGWGPEGQLNNFEQLGTEYKHVLHWDGDQLLFVTDGNGKVQQLNIDDLQINGNGTAAVLDRDWMGNAVEAHDATGYSQWTPPNPTLSGCPPDNLPGASVGYDIPQPVPVSKVAIDGYIDSADAGIYFSGVRSYDPNSGQWASSDSMLGSPGDPVSMKSFVWNRNNPLLYVDPSGMQSGGDECPTDPDQSSGAFGYCNVATGSGGVGGYPSPGLWPVNYMPSPPVRAPIDFTQLAVCFGSAYGSCGTAVVDRCHGLYFGVGPNLGKSALAFSASYTLNWFFNTTPTAADLAANIRGDGYSAGVGAGYGGQVSGPVVNGFEPQEPTSGGFGLFTPQAGASGATLHGPFFQNKNC